MNKILKKVVILGDAGVGKTALMNMFVNQEFTNKYKATIGADFETNTVNIDGKAITLQIWDTAGQERFQSLVESFYRGSDAAMLVFNVNVQQTFDNLPNWRNDFLMKSGTNLDDFPFVVVGNQIDLAKIDRAVSTQTAKDWASSINATYFETSAKDGSNVEKAFMELAKKSLGIEQKKDQQTITFDTIKTQSQNQESKCSC